MVTEIKTENMIFIEVKKTKTSFKYELIILKHVFIVICDEVLHRSLGS